MSEVTAVVLGVGSGARTVAEDVDAVVAAPSADLRRVAGSEARTRWLWLLDAGAVPAPGALAALFEHAERPAVSAPIDERGEPIEPLLGRFTEADAAGIVAAAGRGLVPLRHAPLISLLVERELVAGLEPPDPRRFGPWAGTEWTARLFARSGGMLVPASRVRATLLPPPTARQAAAMARSGVWHRGETLRELHRAAGRRVRRGGGR